MTKRTRWLGLVLALAMITALFLPGSVLALPASPPKIGLVCLNGPTFNLVATSGTIQTPDGNQIFMWSYADGSGIFQYPGPFLCVTQGQTVTVNLTNNLPEVTSIVFPGQEGVSASGSGTLDGVLTTEIPSGGTITYTFTANHPGTYLYESGTDVSKQVEMGLYGALIVRPGANPAYAYDASTQFDPKREYVLLLSEMDPDLHHAVETGGAYDFNALHNRYFMVNGRGFPDTIQENGSALLPTQPYGSLIRIQPTTGGASPALIRMLNAGLDNHPFHPHGNHTTQIAQDGRQVAPTEHFGETIGSGQTLDYLIRWDTISTDSAGQTVNDTWDPVTNPLPVAQPNYNNLLFISPTFYSGNPYLGYKGTLPTGTSSLNVCGEWYFPMHSHALNEFANFDEPFGGMATLLRVDPLGGCFAFPSSTQITLGTLNSGTYADLSASDAAYYKVNSTITGTRTTDWYGQFSGIPGGAANLKVTYAGNNAFAAIPQNFNTLASSGNTSSSLPAGWAFSESGSGSNGTYGINNGSSGTANTYSYGSNGSTDRAFGTLRGSNSFATIIGAGFTNNTGGTIISLTVSYTGEQWRKGTAGAVTPDRLDFQYSTNATSLTTGTWTDVNGLDFSSPVTIGGLGSLDGNAPANRMAKSFIITGLSIPNGATYRIRWTDFDRSGSGDDGLAVDDFSITPGGPSMTTTVYIWNWAGAGSWVQIAGPTAVGAADVTVANNTAVPAYIGTGANRGLVRVRVLTTGGTANFVTGGNFMRLVYDAP